MKNGKLFGVIALAVTMLIGCGPAAHIEKANNIKLNKYQSFAWAQNEKKASRANLAEQKVKDAVSMELEKTMGWREVKSNPDLILSYDAEDLGKSIKGDPKKLEFFIGDSFFKPFNDTNGRHSVYLNVQLK